VIKRIQDVFDKYDTVLSYVLIGIFLLLEILGWLGVRIGQNLLFTLFSLAIVIMFRSIRQDLPHNNVPVEQVTITEGIRKLFEYNLKPQEAEILIFANNASKYYAALFDCIKNIPLKSLKLIVADDRNTKEWIRLHTSNKIQELHIYKLNPEKQYNIPLFHFFLLNKNAVLFGAFTQTGDGEVSTTGGEPTLIFSNKKEIRKFISNFAVIFNESAKLADNIYPN